MCGLAKAKYLVGGKLRIDCEVICSRLGVVLLTYNKQHACEYYDEVCRVRTVELPHVA